MVVAVMNFGSGTPEPPDVALYRVSHDGVAHLLREHDAAPGYGGIVSVAMSGAEDPLTCLAHGVHDGRGILEVRCYAPDDRRGFVVPDGHEHLAVSRDGAGLLSLNGSYQPQQRRGLQLHELHDGSASLDFRTSATHLADGCAIVTRIAWAGGQDVVLTCATSLDDVGPGQPVVQRLDALRAGEPLGAGSALRPTGPLAEGYDRFEEVTPVDSATAVGVLAGGSDAKPKVVRIDLRTGRVDKVLAVDSGRSGYGLTGLGGGAHGVFYYEGSDSEAKHAFVLWPGDEQPTPITGLPTQFFEAVAQP